MPELPEVETVKETLKKQILNRKIIDVKVYYSKLIEQPELKEFEKNIKGEKINDIKRRGKWLMFELNHYYLLSHLRMEGKYYLKNINDPLSKHDHIAFTLDNNIELRYNDTRKFGRMYLLPKAEVYNVKPLNELGLEPWDKNLTVSYLKEKLSKKTIAIKTSILDQSIIVGNGNIYVDEVLFLSKINPLKKSNQLLDIELEQIINNTKSVLENAIKAGGTTIRSYTSSEGVHGRFQHELLVHGKEGEKCPTCSATIIKIKVNGRGTYYCSTCQK